MALALFNPYDDEYGNPKPNLSEEGLQWVSEEDSHGAAYDEFDEEVGVGLAPEDFEYVELPQGASEWNNRRVLDYTEYLIQRASA